MRYKDIADITQLPNRAVRLIFKKYELDHKSMSDVQKVLEWFTPLDTSVVSMKDVQAHLGIDISTLYRRIRRGVPIDADGNLYAYGLRRYGVLTYAERAQCLRWNFVGLVSAENLQDSILYLRR